MYVQELQKRQEESQSDIIGQIISDSGFYVFVFDLNTNPIIKIGDA